MAPTFQPLAPTETFCFACHPGVPCFNHCCRDLTQHLTPYDILRLVRGLDLSSTEFLKTHTVESTGPQSGLPIIALKPIGPERLCPFVDAGGCRVYADRPASCRTYPLARAVGIRPGSGETIEQFALIRESHCRGFQSHRDQTAAEWVADQGLTPYNEMNDLLLGLIQQKRQRGKAPLKPSERALFHLALYDPDQFRHRLKADDLPGPTPPAGDPVAALEGSDTELLRFAVRWLATTLFGPAPHS
jgi:Fe-S-cluster containining protein